MDLNAKRVNECDLTPTFHLKSALFLVGKLAVLSFVVLLIIHLLLLANVGLEAFHLTILPRQGVSYVVDALARAAWPLLVLVLMFLFKDNLSALLSQVGVCWHGDYLKDAVTPGEKEADDSVASDGDSKSRELHREAQLFCDNVLRQLQEERGVLIQRNARLFKLPMTFDGVVEKNGQFTAIEVKYLANLSALHTYLDGLEHFCAEKLTAEERKHFSLLLCVRDGKDRAKELHRLRKLHPIPFEYRIFSDSQKDPSGAQRK